MAIGLYIAGTLLGGSYSWLTEGWPLYEQIFLTTRNGVFFGLPLLCIGEIVAKQRSEPHPAIGMVATVIALIAEITIVQQKMIEGADCSMYLMLPIFMYFLLDLLLKIDLNISTKGLRGASTAIYVIQYGVITVLWKMFIHITVPMSIGAWII